MIAPDMKDFFNARHAGLWVRVQPHIPAGELAHDALHIMRVYRWCLLIAEEMKVEKDLAGACGLVHDAVHIPKDSADRPLGGERSAELAQGLLPELGYCPDEVREVVEAVRTCSWSRQLSPTSTLGKVLQDADRLDAIGAIGIARCFATAQYMAPRLMDSHLYNPAQLTSDDHQLDDRQYARDHFDMKLNTLITGFHSPLARQEARRRHQTMHGFLCNFDLEVNPD